MRSLFDLNDPIFVFIFFHEGVNMKGNLTLAYTVRHMKNLLFIKQIPNSALKTMLTQPKLGEKMWGKVVVQKEKDYSVYTVLTIVDWI
jgi:hypothetical protein